MNAAPRRRGRPPGGGMSPEIARTRILDAATATFARYGIEKSTIDDVAEEAGLSRSMIYRHFSSRDEILTGVIGRMTDTYIDTLDAAGFTDIEIQTTHVHDRASLEHLAHQVALPPDIDRDDALDTVDGDISNAFVRARRPQLHT